MILLILLTSLVTPYGIHGLRSYTIDILSYHQDFNPAVYKMVTYQLVNHNGRKTINGSSILRRNVDDFDVSLKLISVSKKNELPWILLDTTFSGCTYRTSGPKKTFNLINAIIMGIQTSGNITPGKCPRTKDKEFVLNYFYLDAEKFPPNVPKMKLNVLVRFQEKKLVYYKANLTVAVRSK